MFLYLLHIGKKREKKKRKDLNLFLYRFACVWYTIGFREGRGGPGRRVCDK